MRREKAWIASLKTWLPVHRRILVPLDGSRLAESILPLVASMASTLKLEVILLHVTPPDERLARATSPSQKKALESIDEYLNSIVEDLQSQGVHAAWRVTSGHPVEAIVRLAAEGPVDLIALSTHGTGEAQAPLGSVALAILGKRTKPVLILKPEQLVAEAEG